MPVGQAFDAAAEGAAFGFFPIMWIVINAIWIYNMTRETGHFDVLGRSFSSVSSDQRIQALIVAFCFGALLEALAGFGTPVAITSVMLIALGLRPLKAAAVALAANTGAVVVLLRVWQPSEPLAPEGRGLGQPAVAGGAVDDPGFSERVQRNRVPTDSRAEVVRAYLPYAVIIIVFGLAQIGPIKSALDSVTVKFAWPGLSVVNSAGKAPSSVTFNANWLITPGTLVLIAGLITMPLLRLGPVAGLRNYGRTLNQLKWAILTVLTVLALAYVMNLSGQTITLGKWMAGAGGFFAFLSSILGWVGVAVSGSDTSSNSLFGLLQVTAGHQTGLSPTLLAAANSSGGVLGKMISPQNLAIGASAVGMAGQEGEVFRRVLGWSLLFLLVMCFLVFLQSTVLSGMVVGG